MMEVSLLDILNAREARAQQQQQLLAKYRLPLICFTMNIAGPVKDSPLIRRGFRLGKELLEQQLSVFRVRVVHFEEISEKTGCEAFYILDCDALTAKKAAVTVFSWKKGVIRAKVIK